MSAQKKDVHNEHADVQHKNGKAKQKKGNKCQQIKCRNATSLANHANNCQGYEKYASNGDSIKSRVNDLRN